MRTKTKGRTRCLPLFAKRDRESKRGRSSGGALRERMPALRRRRFPGLLQRRQPCQTGGWLGSLAMNAEHPLPSCLRSSGSNFLLHGGGFSCGAVLAGLFPHLSSVWACVSYPSLGKGPSYRGRGLAFLGPLVPLSTFTAAGSLQGPLGDPGRSAGRPRAQPYAPRYLPPAVGSVSRTPGGLAALSIYIRALVGVVGATQRHAGFLERHHLGLRDEETAAVAAVGRPYRIEREGDDVGSVLLRRLERGYYGRAAPHLLVDGQTAQVKHTPADELLATVRHEGECSHRHTDGLLDKTK